MYLDALILTKCLHVHLLDTNQQVVFYVRPDDIICKSATFCRLHETKKRKQQIKKLTEVGMELCKSPDWSGYLSLMGEGEERGVERERGG